MEGSRPTGGGGRREGGGHGGGTKVGIIKKSLSPCLLRGALLKALMWELPAQNVRAWMECGI